MPTFTGQEISTAHARKLVQNYLRNKWTKNSLKKDESKGVWFSKEVLLSVLGLSPDTDTKNISGARFYFAAYEDKEVSGEPPKDKKYKGMLTLVIVQTQQTDDDDEHKDILTKADAEPKYDTALEYNDGQLCPPPRCHPTGLLNDKYVKP